MIRLLLLFLFLLAAPARAGFEVETVAEGLEIPWALAFAPDGRIFVTERPGRVRVLVAGKLRPEPFAVIGDVNHAGEGGLMDIELHPEFAKNRRVYVSYSYKGGRGQVVRIVRYEAGRDRLSKPKVLVDDIPAARYHDGCRLAFGPDGKLYVTTGDAVRRDLAQRLDSLAGKTLRLNDDGTAPKDNPFVGRPGARAEIWSYGHRNAQGLAWQPDTGTMFQTEHGPSGFDGPGGGDEVNIVERGRNYGWPVIHHRETRDGMVAPLLEYTPAVAPGSGMFYTGAAFPAWRGHFFFGCLRGRRIIRVELEGRKVVTTEALVANRYGRIREVAEGPDGALYFTTSNRDGRARPGRTDDRILRLVPAR